MYMRIYRSIRILKQLLKFSILKFRKYHDLIEKNNILQFELPKNAKDVENLKNNFPDAIIEIEPELLELISLKYYGSIIRIIDMNPLLHYTLMDTNLSKYIGQMRASIVDLNAIKKKLIKKMLIYCIFPSIDTEDQYAIEPTDYRSDKSLLQHVQSEISQESESI
jgi:hypothetical protein